MSEELNALQRRRLRHYRVVCDALGLNEDELDSCGPDIVAAKVREAAEKLKSAAEVALNTGRVVRLGDDDITIRYLPRARAAEWRRSFVAKTTGLDKKYEKLVADMEDANELLLVQLKKMDELMSVRAELLSEYLGAPLPEGATDEQIEAAVGVATDLCFFTGGMRRMTAAALQAIQTTDGEAKSPS